MPARPLYPFIEHLQFSDKDADLLPLGPNLTRPQRGILQAIEATIVGGQVPCIGGTRDIRAGTPTRLIILKARQMGVSTLIEACMFAVSQLKPRSRNLIVSHDLDSSKHLLDMTRRYWETSFIARDKIHTPKNEAGNLLSWFETDSSIRVTTAKNAAGARSHTLTSVHASEVAFWDGAKELMKALGQSVPRRPLTFIFLESTANGVGNYYEQTWNAAVEGDNAYLPLFYPWWQHPPYEAQHIGLEHLTIRPLRRLTDDERALAKAFSRMGMDDKKIRAKLIWRREIMASECNGDIDTFRQEYPATPDEAFVATGRNVFPRPHLDSAYEPMDGETGMLTVRGGRVEFVRDRLGGKLTIFRHPSDSAWYTVGADAAKQAQGDYAVACVIDRTTWEQVAEFRDDIDPTTFAEQIILLGHYYNEALLVPETNMSGGAVAEIARTQYPNVYIHQAMNKVRGQMDNQYGFNTNQQTKPEVIGNLKRALVDRYNGNGTITYHSRVLHREMKGYVLDAGKYKNSNSDEEADHDDTVMAFGLALIGTIHEADSLDRPMPSRGSRRKPVDDAEMGARRIAALMDATPAMPTVKSTGGDDEWADSYDDSDDSDDAKDPVLGGRVVRGRDWSDADHPEPITTWADEW